MKLQEIDGTIDEVAVRRPATPRRAAQYETVDIINTEGVTTTLHNLRAQSAVSGHIRTDAAGRFYLYDVAGFRGICGFRPVVGEPVFDFPRSPAWACLAIALVNLVWIVWRTRGGGDLPLIGLAPFMLACIFYASLRRASSEAGARVANDRRPVIIPGQPMPAAVP